MSWEPLVVIVLGAVIVTIIDMTVLGIDLTRRYGYGPSIVHNFMYMMLGIAIVNARPIVAYFFQ